MEDSKKWLYDALSKKGYDLGDYKEYETHSSEPESQKWLYDNSVKAGLDVGSFDEFKSGMGFNNVNPATANVPLPLNIGERPEQGELAAKYELPTSSLKTRIDKAIDETGNWKEERELDKKQMPDFSKLDTYKIKGERFDREKLLAPADNVQQSDNTLVPLPLEKEPLTGVQPKNTETKPQDITSTAKPYLGSYENIRDHYFSRFSMTDEGKQAQAALAETQKDFTDILVANLKESQTYKDIMSSTAAPADKDKAIQALWEKECLPVLDKQMQPFFNEYSNQMMKRYSLEMGNDIKKLDQSIARNSWESIGGRIAEYEGELKKRKGGWRNAGSPTYESNVARIQREANSKDFNEKSRQVSAARSMMEGSQKMIEAADAEAGSNFFEGLGRGFKDEAFNLDNWTMGLKGLADGQACLNVLEKCDKKGPESLNKEEQLLMDAMVSNAATQAYFQSELGRGYKAGSVTGISLPFMVDMLTGVAAVSSGTKAATKGLMKWIAKNYTKNAVRKNIAKGVTGLAKGVVDSTIHTASFGMGRVANDYTQREIGNVQFETGPDGPQYAGREGAESGIGTVGKAFVSTGLETQSELIGNQFAPALKFVGRQVMKLPGFKNIPASDLGKYLKDMYNSASVKGIREFAKHAQFQGPVAEYAEEVYNNLGSVAIGDMTPEQLVDVDQNIDTFLGVGVMSAAFGLVGTGAFIREKYKTGKEIKSFEEKMKEHIDFDRLKADLQKQDIQGARGLVKQVMNDTSLSADEKKEEIRYIANVLKEAAMNGAESETGKESLSPDDIEEGKAIIYSEFETTRKKVERILPPETVNRIDAGEDINSIMLTGELSEEQQDAIIDYQASKADFDDYLTSVRNKVTDARESARKEVEGVSNPDMGAVVRVNSNLSPNPVHIVGGKLSFDEEGFVDETNSSDIIYYIDEDGKRKMADPSAFVSLVDMNDTESIARQAEADAEAQVVTEEQMQLPQPYVPSSEDKVITKDGIKGIITRIASDYAVVFDGNNDHSVPLSDIMPLNEVENEGLSPSGESKVSENEIQSEDASITSSMPADAPAFIDNEPVPVEEQPVAVSPIPVDDKGNLLYHKAKIEDTIADLTDGTLDDNEIDEFVNANRKEAMDNLAKLEKKLPKMGTNKAKYLQDKAAHKARMEEEQQRIAYWNSVEKEIKSIREKPGDAVAEEILSMEEPMNGEEFAAQQLANGNLPLLQSSFANETGFGKDEIKKYFGLFSSNEKGGMTIQEAGEALMQSDRENGSNFFDPNDPNAGRDAIINVLSQATTRSELANIIKKNREEAAERERAAEYEAYETFTQESFHMTPQEYEAHEEVALPVQIEKYKGVDIDALFNDIIDNEYGKQEEGIAGSDAILQGEGVVPSERTGTSENVEGQIESSLQSGAEDGALQERTFENEIKPVGTGYFGDIYNQFRGKAKEAIRFLLKKRSGEAVGALFHKDVGEIDLVWGKEGTGKSNGFGLSKLAKFHPEVLDNLQEIINDMSVISRSAKRINLESKSHKAAVRLEWDGNKKNWLLTAFEKEKPTATDRTTDIGSIELQNDTAPLQTESSSVNKDNTLQEEKQENANILSDVFVAPSIEANENVLDYASRIVKEKKMHDVRQSVNPNPTEAQKEAGNYKKGHIKLDGCDISIENPKGSERSGVDANGQEWSITMNNDYGYIRGTKAVDGDHIDIFLSDNPTEGNVFVVDQLNENGVFDESKVMYGFASADEARSAYLSNYSPGWESRIGAITEVSKDKFKKWIDSSVRKTKPFSEYKSITPLSDEKDNEKSGSDGKVLDERPLSEDEISNSGAEQELKDGALAYLRGDVNFATQIAYQSIYNDVRDRSGNSERNSESSVPTQLGETADGDRGRTGSRRSGRSGNQLDKEGSESVISGNEERGQDSVPHLAEPFGKGSNKQVHESSSRTKRSATGDTGRRGSGSNRSNGHNVRSRRGDRVGKTNVTVNGGRGTETDRERDSIADEINQLLDDWKKAGNDGTLSMTVIPGLNAERVKILSKLVVAGARYGFTYLKDGVTGFKEWSGKIREMLGAPLSNVIGLTDAQIDDFIADMWNYPHTIDGRTMKLSQWAAELGGKELRKQVRMGLEEKKRLQDAAEPVKVKFGDKVNIEETLPYLLPQQQEDVLRAETQFFDESHADREHANGKGYMFTNGTGTGKTYTGLGIIKRFIKQGKGRVLVLTPSKTKVDDWCKDAGNLSIDLVSLDKWADKRGTTATTEAGEGAVITTYANFRQNQALLESEFDLVVYDESHRLLENKKGENTTGAQQHYMVSNRNEREAMNRYRKISPVYESYRKAEEELASAREALNLLRKHSGYNEIEAKETEYEKRVKEAEFKRSDAEQAWEKEEERLRPIAEEAAKRTKVVFLSATPFNTRDNLEYAEGYIFSYPKEDENTVGSYRHKSPRSEFYLQQFGAGYKFRYGRLENSSGNAEALARQEVQFSDYLQNELGTMSGRIIDSEYDYSRDFPTVSLDMSDEINDAMQSVYRDDELRPLRNAMRGVWGDYNYSSALFETMKVAAMMPRIKAHLALGRKIVIFHRRVEVKQPLQPPYHRVLAIAKSEMDNTSDQNEKQALAGAIALFEKKYDTLLKWEATLDYSMPRVQIAKALGEENVLFFSGKESDKVKNKAVETFNNDDSGKNVIVIQEASGKEGISLHDRSGKHQRVCITLALPQSPITALQIEGRIYRIGNKSNAIFEYPLLGLDSEMMLFGQQFNSQVSTTENLALGSMARNLRESFAKGVEEHSGEVPLENQGIGGKEFDKPLDEERDAFDGAVLDYYGNQKLSARRDSREGHDYFPTPEPLGFKMAEWAQLTEGETVLEPSAGHGAIARYVSRANGLTAVEPSNSLFSKLQIKAGGNGRKFVNDVFENYNVVNKHDAVLMNPPFGTAGRMAIDHLAKAFQHLEEGGRVIAIIPRGSTDVKFDKWYEEAKNAVMVGEIQLPDVLFERAGTKVRCRVVVIDKVSDKKLAMEASSKQVRVDLGKYDKIEDFFEGLKNVEMPRRTIDTNGIMAKKAKKAAKELEELKVVKSVEVNGVSINVKAKNYRDSYYFNWSGNDEIPLSKEEIRGKLAKEYNMLLRSSRDEEVKNAVRDMLVGMSGMTEEELSRYGTLNNNVGDVAKTAKAVADNAESIYTYEQGIHSKTGKTLHLAKPKERISPEQYAEMKAKAGEMGGYWSSFAKGFIFPSEETAKRFIDGAGIIKDSLLYRDGEKIQRDGDDKVDTILPSKRVNARKVDVRFRQTDEVNRKFNEELSTLTEENADKVTFNLGTPSEVLLSGGIANKPMKLYGNKVIKKMKKHGFNLSELKNLPEAVANPIAVFDNLGREGNRSILTELKTENGNFLVTIDLGESKDIDFNIVSSVFGKTDNKVVNWINKGYATYINKEKALDYLYYPAPIAETPKSQELSSATKIVESFENPTLEQGKINAAVDELSESLHTSVKKITSVDQLPNGEARRRIEKGANVKGWFVPGTGEVAVYLPNISNEDDARRTVFHEVIGHYGLRKMFGKDFDTFLDNVYANAEESIRKNINARGGDKRVATEEYLSELAERGFEDEHERTFWQKIKDFFIDMLRKAGVDLGFKLGDNELRYILWKSYQNLNENNILDIAKDVAKQYEWNVGNYRFRETDQDKASDGSREAYEKSVKGNKYKFLEAYQDSMLSLKKLQEVISEISGKPIQDFENAYLAENQLSSKNESDTEKYYNEYFEPLEKEIARLIKSGMVSYDELSDYMILKHGMERNIEFSVRDAIRAIEKDQGEDAAKQTREDYEKDKADLRDDVENGMVKEGEYLSKLKEIGLKYADEISDYSGTRALLGRMTGKNIPPNTEEKKKGEAYIKVFNDTYGEDTDMTVIANDAIKDFETKFAVEPLWEKVNAATKSSLKKSYESGLMGKEAYTYTDKMFRFYVPLRGWDEKTADEEYEYLSSERSPVNSVLKAAKGRKSIPDNPIPIIRNMAESTILMGNRNLMKQSFMSMVMNHPTDVATIKKAWYVKDPVTDEWSVSYPNIEENDSAQDIDRKIEEHEERMKELEETGNATQKIQGLNMNYRTNIAQTKEHIVSVKRNGKDYIIYINGNPRAAQAINGMTNPDVEKHPVMKALGVANRWLAANFTTRNPAFVLSNLLRDLIFAQSAVLVKESPEYAGKFFLNVPKAMKAIMSNLNGKGNPNKEINRYFKEFIENGGETGYMTLTDVDKYKKKVKHDLERLSGSETSPKKVLRWCVDSLEDFNRWAEDVSRFTTYMTSRQMGRSITASINDAKEVTVNFNKKGAGFKTSGIFGISAGLFKSLYLFFNAGVQSLTNFGRLAKGNPVKFGIMLGGFTAAGFVVPALVNQFLIATLGGGDDDPYKDLPDWIRRNNLCLYIGGGKFATIPLPIELRAFYGLGEMAYSYLTAKGKIRPSEMAYDMANQMTELLPLNPLGHNGEIVSTIMPDALKPFWQINQNKDFTGKPIWKKTSFNELDPEFKRVYKGTSGWLVDASQFLNDISGGSDFRKGIVDMNPAKVEHLFESYFGGMGKTFNQLGKSLWYGAKSIVEGEKNENLKLRNVPALNRFITEIDERSAFSGINKEYYRMVNEFETIDHEVNGLTQKASLMNPKYLDQYTRLTETDRFKWYRRFKQIKENIDKMYETGKNIPDEEAKKDIEMQILNAKRIAIAMMKENGK